MKKYLIAILCGLISACASLPLDTFNKRVAAFEIAYGEALKTVQLWISEGRLAGADKTLIQGYIKSVSDARQALYVAKGIGDLKTAQGQLNAASASLKLVRDYLISKESKPSASVYSPRHFHQLLARARA